MTKPTEKQLQAELEQLKINHSEAVKVQQNCERRAIEVSAILNYLKPEKKGVN